MYYSVETIKILGASSGVIYSLAVLPRSQEAHLLDSFNLLAVTSPKAVGLSTSREELMVLSFLVDFSYCLESADESTLSIAETRRS